MKSAARSPSVIFESLESRQLLSGANKQLLRAHVAPAASAVRQPVVSRPVAVTSTGVTINTAPGAAFSGVIAKIKGLRGIAAVSIDWGDGLVPTTAYTVARASDGTALISASHTWAVAGAYNIVVTITPTSTGMSLAVVSTVRSTALVATAGSGIPLILSAVAAKQFTQSVGSFIPRGSARPIARIDWGDGSTTAGNVAVSPAVTGLDTVSASHTYAQPGHYVIHVTVTSSGSGPVSTIAVWNSTANVIAPTPPPT